MSDTEYTCRFMTGAELLKEKGFPKERFKNIVQPSKHYYVLTDDKDIESAHIVGPFDTADAAIRHARQSVLKAWNIEKQRKNPH